MPGLVEQHPHDTSANATQRRGVRATWRRVRRALRALWSRRSAADQQPAIANQPSTRSVPDPITPDVQRLVCAAFPRPSASEALHARVAEGYRRPETAPRGLRIIPPRRGRTRNGLSGSGWGCSARLRWGSLGALTTLLIALWLTLPRGDLLAAAIRATEAAPVIHITGTMGNGSFESWTMPGVGSRIETEDAGRQLIVVDDRKRQYLYHVNEGRVEIEPSDLAQPSSDVSRIGEVWTGAGLLKQLQSWTDRPQTQTDEVSDGGVTMRRLQVSLPKGERMTVFIDPRTDRIARIDSESTGPRGKIERRTARFDYPDPKSVDRSLFRFQMPKGVWLQDHVGGEGARPEGEDTRCWKHMDGVMKAMFRAAEENNGQWPKSLREVLGPYEGVELLRCPVDPKGGPDGTSYRYHRPSPEAIAKMKAIWKLRKTHGKVKLPFPWPYDVILLEHCHGGRPILYVDAVGRTMDVKGEGSRHSDRLKSPRPRGNGKPGAVKGG